MGLRWLPACVPRRPVERGQLGVAAAVAAAVREGPEAGVRQGCCCCCRPRRWAAVGRSPWQGTLGAVPVVQPAQLLLLLLLVRVGRRVGSQVVAGVALACDPQSLGVVRLPCGAVLQSQVVAGLTAAACLSDGGPASSCSSRQQMLQGLCRSGGTLACEWEGVLESARVEL
jgi:hypothetical protein